MDPIPTTRTGRLSHGHRSWGEQGKAAVIRAAGWRVLFLREGEKDPIEGKLSDVLFLPESCEGFYAMEVRSFTKETDAEPASKSWQLASSFHQGRGRAGLGAMFHATMGAKRVEWSVYRYQGLESLEIERGVGHFSVEGPYKGHQDD